MTKNQRYSLLVQLGCIVCRNNGRYQVPAEIHHVTSGLGKTQRDDMKTIPLCPMHHRNGGHGIAIHAGRVEFELRYGDELALLGQVNDLIRDGTVPYP